MRSNFWTFSLTSSLAFHVRVKICLSVTPMARTVCVLCYFDFVLHFSFQNKMADRLEHSYQGEQCGIYIILNICITIWRVPLLNIMTYIFAHLRRLTYGSMYLKIMYRNHYMYIMKILIMNIHVTCMYIKYVVYTYNHI